MTETKAVTKAINPEGMPNHSANHSEVFRSVGKHVAAMTLGASDDEDESDDEDPKVVDEIESLCMNCGENVCYSPARNVYRILQITNHGLRHRA